MYHLYTTHTITAAIITTIQLSLWTENSADVIVYGEGNFDWEVLKQLCDMFGLFSYVSKLDPFLCIHVFLFLCRIVVIIATVIACIV